MGNIKLPAIFNKYDQKAIKKQYKFLCILKFKYIFAIILAFMQFCGPLISLPLLGYNLIILYGLCTFLPSFWEIYDNYKGDPYRKEWYKNRIIAESLKSSIWKLYMGATEHSIKEIDDNQITNYIAEVAHNKEIKTSDISDMLDLIKEYRNLPLQERKELYVKDRIEDQISWYNGKIIENNTEAKKWMIATIILTIIYISAVIKFLIILYDSKLLSIIMSIINYSIGWTNTKRFNELSASYEITANEIKHILGKKETIDNEDKFANWVIEAETVFSKEHKIWATRRGINPK